MGLQVPNRQIDAMLAEGRRCPDRRVTPALGRKPQRTMTAIARTMSTKHDQGNGNKAISSLGLHPPRCAVG